jgi:hypothetical protein
MCNTKSGRATNAPRRKPHAGCPILRPFLGEVWGHLQNQSPPRMANIVILSAARSRRICVSYPFRRQLVFGFVSRALYQGTALAVPHRRKIKRASASERRYSCHRTSPPASGRPCREPTPRRPTAAPLRHTARWPRRALASQASPREYAPHESIPARAESARPRPAATAHRW